MKNNYFIIGIAALALLINLSGCKTPVQEQDRPDKDPFKNTLLETNQYIRERHDRQINAFIKRVGWKMIETPTGLRYMILEPGNGNPVEKDKRVTYSYETRLLNGTFCYKADTLSPKTIVSGMGNIEAGLEEGLLHLREGDKARFIIPPYLAHGSFGDRNKIPGSAILLIEVEILNVKR